MAHSKITYYGETLIDLTEDSVDENSLVSGKTAHKADGTRITGNLSIISLYTGTTTPESSVGSDNDIFIVL